MGYRGRFSVGRGVRDATRLTCKEGFFFGEVPRVASNPEPGSPLSKCRWLGARRAPPIALYAVRVMSLPDGRQPDEVEILKRQGGPARLRADTGPDRALETGGLRSLFDALTRRRGSGRDFYGFFELPATPGVAQAGRFVAVVDGGAVA